MIRYRRWGLIVITVQAALIGVYWFAEQQRIPLADTREIGTDPPRIVDIVMPRLTVHRRNGSTIELPLLPERPTLVHIWATWCPPCRTELPGLLTLSAKHAVDVVVIALDDDWRKVERFMKDLSATEVFLDNEGETERKLDVQTLPVTFLVQKNRRIRFRFDGARNWNDSSFVQKWLGKL